MLGKIKDLKQLIKDNNMKEIIVAIPSATGETIKEINKISKELR